MSLSWRKRVALAVYPDRLVWLRAGQDGKEVVAKGARPCSASQGVLALLPEVMREAGAVGCDVSILLSNRLVRYAIVHNPDSASGRQEVDLLTRHAFERVHGTAVDGWEMRLSSAAPGRAAFASAVDRDLLHGLRDVVAGSKAYIASIRPYLMAAFNQAIKRSLGAGVFVQVEPQRISLLAWQEHGWIAVQQAHGDGDWQGNLPGTLDRMLIGLGMENLREYHLFMPEMLPAGIPQDGWQARLSAPRWPQGLSPVDDRSYAGAMLAMR